MRLVLPYLLPSHVIGENQPKCENKVIIFFTCGAKLPNADLIGWERGHHEGTFGNQEGMISWCWLAERACIKLVFASNGFWKGISETHRFWVEAKRSYVILTWKKMDMQQSAVHWWKRKTTFPSKNVWIRSLKKFWVGTAGVARSIELQHFIATKLKVNFFVLLRVAFLVLHVTLSA